MIDILLILGFVIGGIGGFISVKFKYENRKKWWVPLVIGGSILVVILVWIVSVALIFFNTMLCV